MLLVYSCLETHTLTHIWRHILYLNTEACITPPLTEDIILRCIAACAFSKPLVTQEVVYLTALAVEHLLHTINVSQRITRQRETSLGLFSNVRDLKAIHHWLVNAVCKSSVYDKEYNTVWSVCMCRIYVCVPACVCVSLFFSSNVPVIHSDQVFYSVLIVFLTIQGVLHGEIPGFLHCVPGLWYSLIKHHGQCILAFPQMENYHYYSSKDLHSQLCEMLLHFKHQHKAILQLWKLIRDAFILLRLHFLFTQPDKPNSPKP